MAKSAVSKHDPRKATCSRCGGERNCDVFGYFDEQGSDDFYIWHTGWYLLKCRGCDHVFVQLVSTNSEDYDNYYDERGEVQTEYHETISYYPAQSKRQRPEWLALIRVKGENSHVLTETLGELYSALESDLHILASIGMRTSFDAAAELLGVDEKLPFALKLDTLVDLGHIGKRERALLEALVEAGSASAHRGWKPSPEDIATMMDVLENFLHDAFAKPEKDRLLAAKVQLVKLKVPPRAQ